MARGSRYDCLLWIRRQTTCTPEIERPSMVRDGIHLEYERGFMVLDPARRPGLPRHEEPHRAYKISPATSNAKLQWTRKGCLP